MGILGRRNAGTAREFIEQRNLTRKTAVQQASERGVDVIREASRIGSQYDFAGKRHTWDYFDAAMGILARYPPQLGMAVLSELGQHPGRLGYDPVGELIIAMSHLDKDFTPDEVARFSSLGEVRALVQDKPERMRRAALTLARVLYGGETLDGALKVYDAHTNARAGHSQAVMSTDMKAYLDSALMEVNPTLGTYIISGGKKTIPATQSIPAPTNRLGYALKHGLVFTWLFFIWLLLYSGLRNLASLHDLPSALAAGVLTGVMAGPGSLRILAGAAVSEDPQTFLRKIYSKENWAINVVVFGIVGALFGLFVYVVLPAGSSSTKSFWSLSLAICPAVFVGFSVIGWILGKPLR